MASWQLPTLTSSLTKKYFEDLVLSEGLSPGDTIVTAGVQFLYPGQVVEVAADGSGR